MIGDEFIMAALQVRLKAFADAQSPPLTIAYELVGYVPSPTAAHLADFQLPAKTGNPVLANSVEEHIGIYQVDVDAPATMDPKLLRRLADSVVAHFPIGLVLTSGGVKVTVKGHPSRGPAIPGNGRTKIPISITYRA